MFSKKEGASFLQLRGIREFNKFLKANVIEPGEDGRPYGRKFQVWTEDKLVRARPKIERARQLMNGQ